MQVTTTEPHDTPLSFAALLVSLQRAQWRFALRNLALKFGCGIALSTSGLIALAQTGHTQTGALGWSAAVLAHGIYLYWQYRRIDSRPNGLRAAAQLAETLAPELGSGPTSAVEFAQREAGNSAQPYSECLAQHHLAEVHARLLRIPLHTRLELQWRPQLLRMQRVLSACCILLLLTLAFAPAGRTRLIAWAMGQHHIDARPTPVAGDIRITYHFPAYTGLKPRTVEGSDGTIEAIAGTEVSLSAVTEEPIRSAVIQIFPNEETKTQSITELPMGLDDDRHIHVRFPVLRSGRYRFVLRNVDNEQITSQHNPAMTAIPDTAPVVTIDYPVSNTELHNTDPLTLLWHAQDDFGITEATLVITHTAGSPPQRVPLTTPQEPIDVRREGRYIWQIAQLAITTGKPITFHIEARDNDTITGPKIGVSSTRTLTILSAEQKHETTLAKQREALDGLVDWLAEDLVDSGSDTKNAIVETQQKIIEAIHHATTTFSSVIGLMENDPLTRRELISAFSAIHQHAKSAHKIRADRLRMAHAGHFDVPSKQLLRKAQEDAVMQLERDIIYLDDLIAIEHIDMLKDTAKELLTAQQDLQELLSKYRNTGDPALREQLQQRITDLRNKMMNLLQKMSSIKESLPGEYRNSEAAQTLHLDDEVRRLEKLLQDGDMDAAARELEQLANMIENMVNAIDEAEKTYGDDRYAGIRKELQNFNHDLDTISKQQSDLADRTKELTQQYRKEALAKISGNQQSFVEKVRKHVRTALTTLDRVAVHEQTQRVARLMESTQQQLLDLDTLLKNQDFATARDTAHDVQIQATDLEHQFAQQSIRTHDAPKDSAQAMAMRNDGVQIRKEAREIERLLNALFPPPKEVLSPKQMAEMGSMEAKQRELQQQAEQLQDRMQSLAKDAPLFGDDMQQQLSGSQDDMQQAAQALQEGRLPGAARYERLAAEKLSAIKDKLAQAAQRGGKGRGGIPMPMGASPTPGGQEGVGGSGAAPAFVEIPKTDQRATDPKFRQQILDAAKQKAPARYEDAVRRYYEELIR